MITGLMATIYSDKYFNSMAYFEMGDYDFDFWVP